jgi:hypothetical protein
MPSSRRLVTVAIVGAVVAGLVAGSGSAAGPRPVDTVLGYTCLFPSGGQQVSVRIEAGFPTTGAVGSAIQPSGVTLTLTLPQGAVADLAALGASTVAGTAQFTVAVSDSGAATEATWSGIDTPATPLPATGDLALTASGPALAATAGKPGEVRFAAAGLTVELLPQRADGSSTEPASLPVSCALDPGQDAHLATVEVPATTSSSTPRAPEQAAPEAAPEPPAPNPATPNPVAPDRPRPKQDEIPPECGRIPPIEEGLFTGCTYITGYSNVKKLNGAVLIEAGFMNVALANFRLEGDYGYQDNRGDMPAGGFPPSTATFLGFGFMPIKATMELTQVDVIDVNVEAQLVIPFDYLVRTTADMSVRIYDVTVNGVPLDVGQNCRTAEPMRTVLSGGTPDYTNIHFGGPLSGIVTIPRFSGCGVHEDLDPLLTGMVSGPDNYVRLTQGNLCVPPDVFCPPTVPVPLR